MFKKRFGGGVGGEVNHRLPGGAQAGGSPQARGCVPGGASAVSGLPASRRHGETLPYCSLYKKKKK